MADMTATGWSPNGAVVILDAQRPYGARGMRRALVQLNFRASWFGTGAVRYPSDGIPSPNPDRVGFRSQISYIIPLSPFVGAAGCGATVIGASDGAAYAYGRKVFQWGCVVPTFGASGASGGGNPRLRLLGGPFLPTNAAGAEPSFIAAASSYTLELTTDVTVTDMVVTGTAGQLSAYALFVGN